MFIVLSVTEVILCHQMTYSDLEKTEDTIFIHLSETCRRIHLTAGREADKKWFSSGQIGWTNWTNKLDKQLDRHVDRHNFVLQDTEKTLFILCPAACGRNPLAQQRWWADKHRIFTYNRLSLMCSVVAITSSSLTCFFPAFTSKILQLLWTSWII